MPLPAVAAGAVLSAPITAPIIGGGLGFLRKEANRPLDLPADPVQLAAAQARRLRKMRKDLQSKMVVRDNAIRREKRKRAIRPIQVNPRKIFEDQENLRLRRQMIQAAIQRGF
jgi:hypothetical protein